MWPTNLLLLATCEHRRKVVEPPSPRLSSARLPYISPRMPVIERPLGAELHSLPEPSRARKTEPQEAPPAFRCVGDVKDDRRGEAQQYRNMPAEAPKLSTPRPSSVRIAVGRLGHSPGSLGGFHGSHVNSEIRRCPPAQRRTRCPSTPERPVDAEFVRPTSAMGGRVHSDAVRCTSCQAATARLVRARLVSAPVRAPPRPHPILLSSWLLARTWSYSKSPV